MNPHFFFKGKLAREEASSAFLATLLDQQRYIFEAFLEMLDNSESDELANSLKLRDWKVRTEADQIDIRLDSKVGQDLWTIFIENKLQAGAVQSEQLRRYYETLNRDQACAKVIAVYLAPGKLGNLEVEDLRTSLREGDHAVHLSWEDFTKRVRTLDVPASEREFTFEGLKRIEEMIFEAKQIAYPVEGTRKRVHEIITKVRNSLSRDISLGMPWPRDNDYVLGTNHTNMTMWLSLQFDAAAACDSIQGGETLCLVARTEIKLSEKARQRPDLRSRWEQLRDRGIIEVPGAGAHRLEGRWFARERQISGSDDDLANAAIKIGKAVIRVVKDWQVM